MRRHPRRAAVDPSNPRAWATSDRTGFIGNHENLMWQMEWAGFRLFNKKILVYPEEYDEPQRQLGSIQFPPDPPPIVNARPEQYYIDEQTFRITQTGQQRYLMDGTPRIESNLQGLINAGGVPG